MEYAWLILPIITLILGFVVCFSGFKLFRASITCLGAVVGFEIGTFLTGSFSRVLSIENSSREKLIVIGVCVLVMAIAAFSFYKKSIIYLTAFAVTITCLKLRGGNAPLKVILIAGLVGVLLGFIIYLVQKWAIMLVTSFGGAYMISTILMAFLLSFDRIDAAFRKMGLLEIGDISVRFTLFVQILVLIFFMVAGFIAQTQDSN